MFQSSGSELLSEVQNTKKNPKHKTIKLNCYA